MLSIFNNPSAHWLRWLFRKWNLEFKYRKEHLHLEYMVEVKNTKFGKYNTVYKHSRLRDAELGDFTYVARNSQIYNTKIGKFTCIGPHVNTGMGAHPSSVFVSVHPLFYSTIGQSSGLVIVDKNLFEEFPETTIGNDVWIGNNVSIKYGVKIGDGAIIGAGAVVTKDVEPYSVIGGVPAKIIKYRFSPEEIDFLERFRWWDRDLEWIKSNKHLFLNVRDLMAKYDVKA
ncbi:MAG: oligosaccharide flippase family protein [Bacteroidota bacterium]|jgi:acetyltransferase-like isoleucine patch superfamily enzyme|nr:oligosaccharide flippase family protein [Bacteroidota bacterium]